MSLLAASKAQTLLAHGIYVHQFLLATVGDASTSLLVAQGIGCTCITSFLTAGVVVEVLVGGVSSVGLIMHPFALSLLVHGDDLLLPLVVSLGDPDSNVIDGFDVGGWHPSFEHFHHVSMISGVILEIGTLCELF